MLDKFLGLPAIALVCFGVAIIACFVHLVFCYKKDKKWRSLTKVYPLLFLTLFSLISFPNHPLLWIAFLCGFFGDLFLIWKEPKVFFLLGMFSFAMDHFLHMTDLIINHYPNNVDNSIYIIYPLVCLMLFVLFVFLIKKYITNKGLRYGGCFYAGVLVSSIIIYAVAAVSCSKYFWFVVIGTIFFIISDGTLTVDNFIKKNKSHEFFIMSTYFIAQILCLIGFSCAILA